MKNLDKCLIFSNLELPHFRLQNMKIKPLIQLREKISAALSSMTNLSKTFQSFIIETMELFLTSSGRMNFTQMARCGRSCESRFRQNFKKPFDWLTFNRHFLPPAAPVPSNMALRSWDFPLLMRMPKMPCS